MINLQVKKYLNKVKLRGHANGPPTSQAFFRRPNRPPPYRATPSQPKIELDGVDPIVAARVRPIEAMLDRECEMRLYGGQR